MPCRRPGLRTGTLSRELKTVFNTSSREEAEKRFKTFSSFNKRYPDMIYALERIFDILTRYDDCPEAIGRFVRSTSIIERMNREVRRRIRIIDSLHTEDIAVKSYTQESLSQTATGRTGY
jgi:putative transposase